MSCRVEDTRAKPGQEGRAQGRAGRMTADLLRRSWRCRRRPASTSRFWSPAADRIERRSVCRLRRRCRGCAAPHVRLPSMTARVRSARVCDRVKPKIMPRAKGSLIGVRSPLKNGRTMRPFAPAGLRSASRAMAAKVSVLVRKVEDRVGGASGSGRRSWRARPSRTRCPGNRNGAAQMRGSMRGVSVDLDEEGGGAVHDHEVAGVLNADAQGFAGAVDRSGHDRRADRKTRLGRPAHVDAADDVAAPGEVRQPLRSDRSRGSSSSSQHRPLRS